MFCFLLPLWVEECVRSPKIRSVASKKLSKDIIVIFENIIFLFSIIFIRTLVYLFLFKDTFAYFYYFFALYKFKGGGLLKNVTSDSIQVISIAILWTLYDILFGRI